MEGKQYQVDLTVVSGEGFSQHSTNLKVRVDVAFLTNPSDDEDGTKLDLALVGAETEACPP